ncbi:MAG TPA: DUF3467 domain-containing protein [Bryobacteraceae bacterium]|nr:DUF3467 domain-containing protein [Bryobacteraceae bacterium]
MDDLPNARGLFGQYANCLNVGYNAIEFVLDFGQYYPGEDAPQVALRIVTSPAYAKRFSAVLERALEDYVASHGSVPEA